MKCLVCKKELGKPKFCSRECEDKARQGFKESVDRLKVKPMIWGGEKVEGSGELW